MAGDNAVLIFCVAAFFLLLGFIVPFVALEYGGTVASFDVNSLGEAGTLGLFNALASVLFWTFGFPAWVNILLFIPIRVMTWYIILK